MSNIGSLSLIYITEVHEMHVSHMLYDKTEVCRTLVFVYFCQIIKINAAI